MVFPEPIFMQLPHAQWHYVQLPYAQFHQCWKISVEMIGIKVFIPVHNVWLLTNFHKTHNYSVDFQRLLPYRTISQSDA